jgi:flagellar biosynthesis/type III secretory pathway protein FliH
VIGAADRGYIDPIMAVRIDDARQVGYKHGFADGAKATEAAARRSAEAALERLHAGAEAARRELATTSIELVPQLMDAALQIAKMIVEEIPDRVRTSLAGRIGAAIEQMDDPAMTVVINPDDEGLVAPALRTVTGVTVRTDPTVAAGDARIEGQWARADLTLGTAWRIVEESLRG